MAVGQMFQARLDQYLTQVHKKWASPTVNVMNYGRIPKAKDRAISG